MAIEESLVRGRSVTLPYQLNHEVLFDTESSTAGR